MHPWLMYQISVYGSTFDTYTPDWSALHLILEKSNMKNQVGRTWLLVYSNLNFAGYTGSKNQVWNRQKINFVN